MSFDIILRNTSTDFSLKISDYSLETVTFDSTINQTVELNSIIHNTVSLTSTINQIVYLDSEVDA